MPHLTRRFILQAGAASAAAGWTTSAHASPDPVVETTPIAPGIFVSTGLHELSSPSNGGHIANVSFVVGGDAVAVIDTGGSAGVGRALLAAIARATDRPVRYVINTHMHPDHVFGNAALVGPQTTFVGHAKLPRALAARSERYLSIGRQELGPEAFAGTTIVVPTRLVDTSLTLDLGGRQLTLKARKTAHTDNDLTIRDEQTGTVFLGDLLFSARIPTLDGSIKGWLQILAELKNEPADRVVPGHGPPSMSWPDAMAAEDRYLETIAGDVRQLIKEGRSLTDAMRTAGLSEHDSWKLFNEFNARNVAAAFAELEWE